MKFLQSTLVIAALAVAFTSCKKETVPAPAPVPTPVPVAKNKIAYIYKTDNTDGQAFKDLMQANGCAVTLLDKSASAAFDYSSFNMIVVGNNTDGTQVTPDWSSAESTAINGSGKPIMFIGIGGLQLALKLNNIVNYGVCAGSGSSLASITVTDPSSSIYKSPKAISIPAGNQLNIFSNPSFTQSFGTSGPVANVLLIGKEAPVSNSYPVAFEQNKYGIFGFYNNVNSMTATGKDFMVNLVYYVGNLSL
jgi:hypothetical protein